MALICVITKHSRLAIYFMKRIWLSLLICGQALATHNAKALTIDKQFEQVVVDFSKLNIVRPQLDFAPMWQTISQRQAPIKHENISVISKKIQQLNEQSGSLTFCQQARLTDIEFQLSLQQEKAELIKTLPSPVPTYQGSFFNLPNGRAWYLHWIKYWLQTDVTIEELQTIAKSELVDAAKRKASLANVNLPVNNQYFSSDEKTKIIEAFKLRERKVYQNLPTFIAGDYKASAINIVESNLPKSFPAPGIYNPSNQSFIYHLQSESLPKAHMDWLFLHEAVPGHHYQSQWAINNAKCSGRAASYTFTEGWAAYTELFGQELGLFSDKSSINYALDWQALRAVRVLIDIGIHYFGWSDEQARSLWLEYIPEQQAIMQREIDRIRNWPVQVITYVYGKAMIQQAVKQIELIQPKATLPEVHANILSLSNLSLKVLAKGISAVATSK